MIICVAVTSGISELEASSESIDEFSPARRSYR